MDRLHLNRQFSYVDIRQIQRKGESLMGTPKKKSRTFTPEFKHQII